MMHPFKARNRALLPVAALAAVLLGFACPVIRAKPASFRPMQITIKSRVFSTSFSQFSPNAMMTGGSCSATCCIPTEGGMICGSASAPMPTGYYPGKCIDLNAICSAAATSVSGGGVTCTCTCNISCTDGGSMNDLIGNGITTGAGGLNNDFGTTRLAGPEQGQATFTPHASRANAEWMKEKERKRRLRPAKMLRSLRAKGECRSPGSNLRYIQSPCQAAAKSKQAGLEKAYAWLSKTLRGDRTTMVQSPVGDLRQTSTPSTTADYENRYLNAIPIGEGQPIGGIGVTQGPPDTLPPPSPSGPIQDRGGDNVRCPKDRPYYNEKSRDCYAGVEQCSRDTSRGKASCPDKSAALPPVTGEPALKSKGKLKCRKAWWLNTGNGKCYNNEKTCKAASTSGTCYQTNP